VNVNGSRAIRWGCALACMVAGTGCRRGEPRGGQPEADRPARAPIVVVFNGCGVAGCARSVGEALRKAEFDVGNGHGENADSYEYPVTLVVDYVGQPAAAQRVADLLGSPMIQQISHDPDRFGSIGVIVGADYAIRLSHMRGG